MRLNPADLYKLDHLEGKRENGEESINGLDC
jgi:hypothetical protein